MIDPTLPNLALSVRQPWAHAIVMGWKDIENRKWKTDIRGPICIHASLYNRRSYEEDREDYLETLHRYVYPNSAPPIDTVDTNGCAFGAIIGTATIVDCVEHHESPWFFGRYGFVLADQKPLEAVIPLKGKLGFFDWRPRVITDAAPATPTTTQGGLFDV